MRLARLSRLELSDREVDLFGRQLGDILAFARQIEAADTSSIAGASPGPSSDEAPLREDVVRGSLDPEQVLAQAPSADREARVFKVPRVFTE
jgi:aspartyl-tRNA(Asn)/glutamyl-tRNA(Gln) amidotransferase subunit C